CVEVPRASEASDGESRGAHYAQRSAAVDAVVDRQAAALNQSKQRSRRLVARARQPSNTEPAHVGARVDGVELRQVWAGAGLHARRAGARLVALSHVRLACRGLARSRQLQRVFAGDCPSDVLALDLRGLRVVGRTKRALELQELAEEARAL